MLLNKNISHAPEVEGAGNKGQNENLNIDKKEDKADVKE